MKRTKIGVLSAIVVIVEALVIGALTMVRTSIILDTFGSNVNGVIQLATSLSSYMLLFESGMTAAYQFNMYKPLIGHDYNKISSLYAGMKRNFISITAKMTVCSLAVAFVYSLVLQNRGVSYAEAVSLLSVMGIRIVAPYLLTISARTLLIIKERKFVTDVVETLKNGITIIIEVLLIKFTSLPLFVILCSQIILTFLVRFIYQYLVNRYYGDELIKNAQPDMSPKSMTSDILVHKIAGLITNNTDSVLLSLFKNLGLNSVTIYTSYHTVINYPVTLVIRLIDSMRATLAIKINDDKTNSYDYYREMFSFSKLCALVIIPVFISQINEFVTLWIGEKYTVNLINVLLFAAIAIHQMMIPTVYAARDAKGLYKESKSYSIVQAIVNLLISLALVKSLGITGVLIGTVICDWLVLEPFNIRLIFKKVFHKKFDMGWDYLCIIAAIAALSAINLWISKTAFVEIGGWIGFIMRSVLIGVITMITMTLYLYATDNSFRKLIGRFLSIKKRR